MRLLRLDLLAYGPFTGRSLPLDEGAFGLHLIFGPNEAGKSSALRALRCLLYGIPTQCPDAFEHSYQQLRIGAVLQDEAAESLHVIRRKGVKDTLRAGDDAASVDPSRLARLLGGIDEAQFRLRFGIDHHELVRGGEDLVHGGGELGRALFAAGAGLADLGSVQAKLSEDAEALFKPGGSVPRINKTLSELDASRKLRKESQLRPTEWTQQMDELRAAQRDKLNVDTQLAQTRTARQRRQRVRQALPLAAKRQRLAVELAEVTDAPRLAAGFPEKRRDTLLALENAKRVLHDAATTLSQIDASLQGLLVSDAVLDSAPLIQQLTEELGAYRKAAKDRPGLVAQRDAAEQESLAILKELDRDIGLDQAHALQLSRAQRARIRHLSDQRQSLLAGVEIAERRRADLERDIEACTARLRSLDAPPPIADLQRALRRARRAGDLDERRMRAGTELARLESQAEIELRRMGLWSGPLETLERLPLPALETVDRGEAELAELDGELRSLEREQADLESRTLELESQIEKLRLSQDALTEDDLAAARRQRETGWRLVQEIWRDGQPAGESLSAFLADFPPAEDLGQAYAQSVSQADAVADRLRRESARVAEKAQLMAERGKADQRQAALAAELAGRRRLRQDRWDAWRGGWQAAGIEPLSPREMRAWLQRHAALADRAAEIRNRREELAQLVARIAVHRNEVQRELEQIGQPTPAADESLADLLDRSEAIAARLDADREQRERAARDRQRLEDQRPAAEQEANAARQQLARWRDDWAAAVAALGLSPEASPAEAQEVTAAIDSLLAKLKAAAEFRERVEGIDADAGVFEQRIQQICAAIEFARGRLPAEQIVVELAARLRQSQDARTRHQELSQQRRREEKRRQDAAGQIDAMNAVLSVLCLEAGCQTPEELPAVEQRWLRRADCERQLREVEDHLLNLAAGDSLEHLLAEAAGADADQLDVSLAQLASEESDLDAQREQLTIQITRRQEALRQMDGGDRAAEAEEQMQSLLARVRADAEEYIRLRLAAVLLKRAIERYREKNQGPVLQRASRIFAALTLGSFSGLRADYDDRGNPVLVGLRPDGRTTLGVAALSEGTRDQLYLSLRIASLEHHLDTNPPLPFVVDDILVQFDDARAAATLQVLADLSDRTQVVFFTHHEHLLDVARRHVAAGKLFVHRLTCDWPCPVESPPGYA
ncbi:MAG: AAA family ATPase [Pirellulaceae bacterium]|nr:AAA family ATPase [Pirellulaceae bacterium]